MTAKGLSYLEAKHALLLHYCSCLLFFLLLKAEGRPVRNHPVLARLVELRLYLEKVLYSMYPFNCTVFIVLHPMYPFNRTVFMVLLHVTVFLELFAWFCIHGTVFMVLCSWCCFHGTVFLVLCSWCCIHRRSQGRRPGSRKFMA